MRHFSICSFPRDAGLAIRANLVSCFLPIYTGKTKVKLFGYRRFQISNSNEVPFLLKNVQTQMSDIKHLNSYHRNNI